MAERLPLPSPSAFFMSEGRMEREFHFLMLAGLLFCSAPVFSQSTSGGLSLSQTRVILSAGSSGENVSRHNPGERPWLIRGRVFTGPEQETPAPFMVTPPLFRLEAGGSNTVRIMPQGIQALPADRESVFYLSFLAIPPSSRSLDSEPSVSVAAQVTVGVDTVIKLFYRPAGLADTPQVAAGKLSFHYIHRHVEVSNPTPYWQTLSMLSFNGKKVDVRHHGSMIAPYSSRQYPQNKQPQTVEWTVITDYGGNSPAFHAVVKAGERP